MAVLTLPVGATCVHRVKCSLWVDQRPNAIFGSAVVNAKMRVKDLQRACIWFCHAKGDSYRQCKESMSAAFPGDRMSERSLQRWWRSFASGARDRDSICDQKRSGRPRTARNDENTTKILDLLLADRHLTLDELAFETDLSVGSVQKIVKKDLKMSRVAAKFVPRDLRPEEKTCRIAISQEWMQNISQDPDLLKRIITGDESWVWCFDPETKQQSSQWIWRGVNPCLKKFRHSRSTKKIMLVAFFDIDGIVHHEFVKGTIKSEVYVQILMNLRDSIRTRRPERWRNHDWVLVDDNASSYTSDETMEFLRQVRMKKGPHPAYSPDLAPCDFFLFSTLKRTLRGRRFDTLDDLQEVVTETLESIPKQAFVDCFDKWQHRWEKCVLSDGNYFEGDKE